MKCIGNPIPPNIDKRRKFGIAATALHAGFTQHIVKAGKNRQIQQIAHIGFS